MGIFFKARSGRFSTSIGLFIMRLGLGSIFLFAGAKKVINLQQFIRSVQDTGQMNETIAFILAFILPFMELIFGALLIIGLFTPIASFFLACMSISFLVTQGAGHPELPFSYNIVFLACAVAMMFTGAGLISFDALLDRNKKLPVTSTMNVEGRNTTASYVEPEHKEVDVVFVEEKDVKKE